jgi:hypothetical protein
MNLGESILSQATLDAVRHHLETVGFVAVLHWHLNQASRPTPLAFAEFDEFAAYLENNAEPGDAVDVWAFPDGDLRIAQGKFPELDGTVRGPGSY